MKKLALFLLCTVVALEVAAQYPLLKLKPKSPIICYAKQEAQPDYIPYLKRNHSILGRQQSSPVQFEITYVNFPLAARPAFEFALSIWTSTLQSDVPVRIRAEWASLEANVLAQAIWGGAFANFPGAQELNTFYPAALAEKIAGKDLNGANEFDVVATFNSNANFYFGTDGNPLPGQYDLVTITLHEVGHGLGITDTADGSGATTGSIGLPAANILVPIVYDLYLENGVPQTLFNSFASPSAAMRTQLISGNLFFNGPLARSANGNVKPRIYAPSTYDGGSSIGHLDEATFNATSDPNKLMTPFIASQEAIHDPGPVAEAMLADMGWIRTRIDNVQQDVERIDGNPYPITAKIVSDNGYDAGTVKLFYTLNGTSFTEVAMTATGNADEFRGNIPGTTVKRDYGYYIAVTDNNGRVFTNPGRVQSSNEPPEQQFIVFTAGPDTEAPEIAHVPVNFVPQGTTQVRLECEVTDNLGVKDVNLVYRINAGAEATLPLTKIRDDLYRINLSIPANLNVRDQIRYRIVATDLAATTNTKTTPATGYYNITVTGILPAQTSYVNNFNAETFDFFGNNFSVTTPSGFTNGAIHSDHPYLDGSGPNSESDYIFQLQVPIILSAENPLMQFDEIVLVEPGEDGSVFGDPDFYDYVIVEGSKDGGTSWQSLLNGYDARARNEWLSTYNGGLAGQNSAAVGTPSLYRKRAVNMTQNGNFDAGETILIRFRLFADPAAHGWGWAIDNLFIQDAITSVEGSSAEISLWPNPTDDGKVLIQGLPDNLSTDHFSFTDARGVRSSALVDKTGDGYQVDASSLAPGLYLIRVNTGKETKALRLVRR